MPNIWRMKCAKYLDKGNVIIIWITKFSREGTCAKYQEKEMCKLSGKRNVPIIRKRKRLNYLKKDWANYQDKESCQISGE